MSFVDFKAYVKKVNLKPKGVKEIVLEINDTGLDGKLNKLSQMIDQKVNVDLESLVVNYDVTIDSKTNKPVTEYKVDDKGVVSEVKPTHEQLEADLELPAEKIKTHIEEEEVDREIVDEFILSGLSPNYTDLPYDFGNIVKRKIEGESYLKLALELKITSDKLIELVDEYRKRVAGSALAWNEWKEENEINSPVDSDGESETVEQSEPVENEAEDTIKEDDFEIVKEDSEEEF